MFSTRITAGVFAIFTGISILGMWAMFPFNGEVPDWNTRPIQASLHLTAEFFTAFLLIAAGATLITRPAWGRHVFQVATGMLFYSVIQSAGYFSQQGQWTYVAMFAVFAILAMAFSLLLIFEPLWLANRQSSGGSNWAGVQRRTR